jgi:hypothetical protein
MDTALLQRWLNLPAGAWPPAPAELLGHPATPADAEVAVLARMELLRPHQLLHPELVTEGMNRLAQALLHYGAAAPVVENDVEVLEMEPAAAVETRPRKRVKRKRFRTNEESLIPLEPNEPVALPPGLDVVPSERRKAYRELVQLRKLREVWVAYGPLVGEPTEAFTTAEAVYLMLSNKRELQTLLMNHPVGDQILRPDYDVVLNLVTSMNPASTVRDLVPSQRERVARLWNAARVKIDKCYEALRESLRDTIPRHPWLKHWRGFVEAFRQSPEWILFVLAGLVILVAVIRWAGAPPADRTPSPSTNQQRP